MELNEIQEKLCQQLSAKRMRHSLGVTETAMQLAQHYGVKVEEARLAGLLHDYARDLPPQTLLALAEKAGSDWMPGRPFGSGFAARAGGGLANPPGIRN